MQPSYALPATLAAILFALPAFADWRPVEASELARRQSQISPDAEAEGLFREVKILNEQRGLAYPRNSVVEYLRIKIFSDRGKDLGNVQIPFFGKETISDVQGRTVHPDGSIAVLERSAVFEKVIEKRGAKVKVVTFALPAVQPGSIIEYKFTRNEGEQTSRYRALEVQSQFPVAELTYYIKPLSNQYIAYPNMRFLPFGCMPEHGKPTREGFEVLQLHNIPAFHDEPYSPPRLNAQQWILIYYEENSKVGKDGYWNAVARDFDEEFKSRVHINGDIKALAAQITAGAPSETEKLDKILAYCRTQLKDITRDEVAAAVLAAYKERRTAAATLEAKGGTPADIHFAFIALARAAGFDARRAELSDRSTFLFHPDMQSRYFLNAFDVAVSVGGKWRFYDITNPALPGGQLRWQEQGVYALIVDAKHPEMVQTPLLSASDNLLQRVAVLNLAEDGSLTGTIREIRHGNFASQWRERNRFTSAAEREDQLREELKTRFADFNATDIRFSVPDDPARPLGVVYHIEIPNYASRTGRRLLIRTNYFPSGFRARFTSGVRQNHIYFDFPWTEADTVELTLPQGFELDGGEAPAKLSAPPTLYYATRLGFDKEKRQISYGRTLTFGKDSVLLFDKAVYPNLKNVFDTVYAADDHTVSLKSSAVAAATQ